MRSPERITPADEEPNGSLPEQRGEERRPTNWIATIRLPEGVEIASAVRDVSPSGARLSVPSETPLPERFMFRVIGRDFVCAVRTVWRRDGEVGVRIERVGKLLVRREWEKEMVSPDPAETSHVRRGRFAQR